VPVEVVPGVSAALGAAAAARIPLHPPRERLDRELRGWPVQGSSPIRTGPGLAERRPHAGDLHGRRDEPEAIAEKLMADGLAPDMPGRGDRERGAAPDAGAAPARWRGSAPLVAERIEREERCPDRDRRGGRAGAGTMNCLKMAESAA